MMKDCMLDGTRELISFCEKYDEIRIYGKGVYGIRISEYLNKLGWKVAGFVVSDDSFQEKGDDTIVLTELEEQIIGGR